MLLYLCLLEVYFEKDYNFEILSVEILRTCEQSLIRSDNCHVSHLRYDIRMLCKYEVI